jgi:tetratricopeptide (TPR) repeat protein
VTVVGVLITVVGAVISVKAWVESSRDFRKMESLTSDFWRETNSSFDSSRALASRTASHTDSNLASVKDITGRFKTEMNGAVERLEKISTATMYGATGEIARKERIDPQKIGVLEYAERIEARAKDTLKSLWRSESLGTGSAGSGSIHLERARKLYSVGNYAEAVAELDSAEVFMPAEWNIFNLRGNAKLKLDDSASALADFDTALKLSAGREQKSAAYVGRGVAKRRSGLLPDAKKDYLASFALDSSWAPLYYNLANLSLDLHQLDSSEFYLSRAVRTDPKYELAYQMRGVVRSGASDLVPGRGLSKYNEAMADFDTASTLNPGNFYNYLYRGIVQYRRDSLESAARFLRGAVILDSTYSGSQAFLGLTYALLGRRDSAVVHLEAALKDSGDIKTSVRQDVRRALSQFK